MEFKDFKLVIYMDLGKNQVTTFNSLTKEFQTIKADDLFEWTYNLVVLNPNMSILIIGEDAHFGCDRKPKSKAQCYTSDQLLGWYAGLLKCGIVLRFFSTKDDRKIQKIRWT